MEYNFSEIEKKWQDYWNETEIFRAKDNPENKFYLLVMFAYPSGDIHMGHFRNYSVADVYGRMKMMQGYDLLFPIGWDAFGLPAEGAAIKAGVNPEEWTLRNIGISSNTLKRLGIGFDWSREIRTCMPDYYKWTQWMFLQFYNAGLAYQSKAQVNWCPKCHTVLANEQVAGGQCWRCRGPVEKKEMEQWFLKITDYAQKLLDGLDELPQWPENIAAMQRNWIGRSEGLELDFELEGMDARVSVFTTRPDTLYGVTFMAMAPEHELVKKLVEGTDREEEVMAYVRKSRLKQDIDRLSTADEKDGVFSGCYAVNPVNGEKVQIWIADYVLASYGTGVVMGVPAHDSRDFLFAKKYGIPVKTVIHPPGQVPEAGEMTEAYTEPGVMVNSDRFDGTPSEEGISAVSIYAEEKGFGKRTVNYRLRDWLVSRQRYWGAPVPMIHCETCGVVPVPESDLPVVLPKGDIDFIPKGRSPLADCEEFMNTICPKCGGKARRDADTFDTFICSSWYYLRYLDPHNDHAPFDKREEEKWMPVDLYIGGSEHACMHLIYFRFFHRFLKDQGWVHTDEPVVKLFNHGMVLDSSGEIMSKSKGNVVSPIHLMEKHSVDATRLAMFFAAPSEKEIMWSDGFIVGVKRFLHKFYSLYEDRSIFETDRRDFPIDGLKPLERKLFISTHRLIKKFTEDLERFQYNTALAAAMEFVTQISHYEGRRDLLAWALRQLTLLLSPMAPHMAEEIWREIIGHGESVLKTPWPAFNEAVIAQDSVVLVVQINGKVKDRIAVSADMSEEDVKALVLESELVRRNLEGRQAKKVVYVPGKLVNIVAG